MSEMKNLPQIGVESVSKDAQRARYTAYMQGYGKLEHNAKADKEGRENTTRMGGAV